MKKLTLLFICILAAALFTSVVAFAQSKDLAGTWQGTLSAGSAQLRIVMKISKDDKGAFSGTTYSIDQGGTPIAMGAINFSGSSVKIGIPAISGSYQGEMSSDGNSIKGTWTQGPTPLLLNLTRATPETAWDIPAPPPPPKPMTATDPSFDVATIKLTDPNNRGKVITVKPGGRQVLTIGTTMNDLIAFAYGMHPKQVINAPDWFDKVRFDVTGQPDAEGMPNQNQMKIMLQKLLVSRFELTFHKDTRELSVYEIVVGKDGPKLTASATPPGNLPGLFFRSINPADLIVRNATIADFAGLMQSTVLDKPVVDHTGITGRNDFELKWTPDQGQLEAFGGVKSAPADDPNAPPDLYTAIQQQIGLKINSTKAPTEVMVIDKVTQPTPN